MKVKDLIKELKKYPPSAKIVMVSSNFELNGSYVDANVVSMRKYKKTKRTFTDAFDYEQYEKEIYVPSVDGEDCITIY